MNSVGKRAYQMYCDEMGGLRVAWERLSDREQVAWKAVAREDFMRCFCCECGEELTCPVCDEDKVAQPVTVNSVSPDSKQVEVGRESSR